MHTGPAALAMYCWYPAKAKVAKIDKITNTAKTSMSVKAFLGMLMTTA
jgi:hypothetical protein